MDKVKWGVIGCGGIANARTIPGMLQAENAVLVAVMDINIALAKEVGEKYQVSVVCESVDELLEQDIDAVYIATPVFLHKKQVIAAMHAGKHVLVEKPVGLNLKEAEELYRMSREGKTKLGVAMLMRFHSQHQQMKEIIASGKLGDIVSMHIRWAFWYPEIEGNWRQKKELSGGGALMDVGVHSIDLMQYISGLKIKGVCAFCDTQTFGYEVDDNAGLFVRMENGAHLYIESNFNIPSQVAPTLIEIYGTRGSIVAEGTLQQVANGSVKVTLLGEESDQNVYFLAPAAGNMYTLEIENFSDAILQETQPLVGIEDAYEVQKIIEAAYKSSETAMYVVVQ